MQDWLAKDNRISTRSGRRDRDMQEQRSIREKEYLLGYSPLGPCGGTGPEQTLTRPHPGIGARECSITVWLDNVPMGRDVNCCANYSLALPQAGCVCEPEPVRSELSRKGTGWKQRKRESKGAMPAAYRGHGASLDGIS
ncbi:hypothetical protein N431DRAFT_557051 [Stipitochalara longipes BDJ]|nr:hypothetical protein N431DRAFT_557051 [Stipitochalara longipes BDJ]